MKPHKHAELIKAWADGAEIQYFDYIDREWYDMSFDATWIEEYQYRIKPKNVDVPEGLIDPKSYYQGVEEGRNQVMQELSVYFRQLARWD